MRPVGFALTDPGVRLSRSRLLRPSRPGGRPRRARRDVHGRVIRGAGRVQLGVRASKSVDHICRRFGLQRPRHMNEMLHACPVGPPRAMLGGPHSAAGQGSRRPSLRPSAARRPDDPIHKMDRASWPRRAIDQHAWGERAADELEDTPATPWAEGPRAAHRSGWDSRLRWGPRGSATCSASKGQEALEGRRSGGKMAGPTWVAGEPSFDLRMLVQGMVVEDGVDRLAFGHLALVSTAAQIPATWRRKSRPLRGMGGRLPRGGGQSAALIR